ncbi:MAG: hypothetical protein M3357_18355 [Actinomycetota bacterium]|nr:hypothetical protein [Actinomycetota bacterium]
MSPLAAIPPGASPEEVAAIVTALAVLEEERRAVVPPPSADRGAHLDGWVRASRLTGRRAGLIRGPWRLAGRIGRRSRA